MPSSSENDDIEPEECPTTNSLVKLKPISHDCESWFHLGIKRDGSLKLREIPSLRWPEPIDGITWQELQEKYRITKKYSPDDLVERLGVRKSDVAVKYLETLISITRRLDRDEPSVTTIPITTLRKFYEWLRDLPGGVGVSKYPLHLALSDYYCNHTHLLAEAFEKSVNEFSRYSNEDEPFIAGRDMLSPRFNGRDKGTDAFVRMLLEKNCGRIELSYDATPIGFTAVARELPPMRSTQASGRWIVEDGRSSEESGGGGIDLLLKSVDGHIPIVGEVKVANDATPFYALIQSLAYAAELCTVNQYKRLQNSFGEQGFPSLNSPRVDIYLISQNEPQTDDYNSILSNTKLIAEKLYERKGFFAQSVRRIVFLNAEVKDERFNFICKSAFGELL